MPAAALQRRLSRFVDVVAVHVRFGGPEVSSYELQSLLGTDKHSSVPTSLDDVKALIADASAPDESSAPKERSWTGELADGIGSTLLEVFDVAEAAGAAASQRFIADKAQETERC